MQTTPLLLEAIPTDDYEVRVRFYDGLSARVDLSYLLKYGGVFEPLRDRDGVLLGAQVQRLGGDVGFVGPDDRAGLAVGAQAPEVGAG